ncbi:MAG: hypothetical protein ACJ0G0_03865 [Alphaproteobacteria bacterium]|tara:strand:+ start:817 stop:1827 length:1011 start_codon:yes stop_codon:yes gene_type:complete
MKLDKNKKESPQQGEYIDLKNTEYKKKSNYLRNIILFLLFITAGLVSGLFIKKEIFQNLNFLKPQSENVEINKEELKNTDNDRISDLEKKLEDYLQKFVQVENNLLNIQSENLKIKKKLEEIKSFPLDIINQSDSIKYEVYFTYEKFKYNFFNNKQFNRDLSKLFQTFSGLDELQFALNFFQRFQPGEIADIKVINKKLNDKISSYSTNLENFAKELEYDRNFDASKVFESKEDFYNYIKNIFSSTFKITKLDERKMEMIPLNNTWIINGLKKSRNYLVIGDLKNFIIELESLGLEDEEVIKILEEAKLLVEINTNLKKIETQIFKLIGKNFDNNY